MYMFRLAHIFFSCIINLLFIAIVYTQNTSERTASISGRVMVDGKPAVNAQVTVVELDPKIKGARIIQSNGRVFVDRLAYKAATNAEGIYLFTGLPAGSYTVTAMSKAYIPENSAQGVDRSRQIMLDEGEAREQVDLSLVRGGVSTGRVTDDENRPQIEIGVRLTGVSDTGKIGEILDENGGATDDRGIYRIYGIRTGRYLLCAGGDLYIFSGKKFELTYYPNTTNAEQAQVIDVKEGSEVSGVDIRLMNLGKTYEVMGRVIEAGTGKAVPQIRVICMEVANQDDIYGRKAVADGLTGTQGNFHMSGLKPGKYKLKLADLNGESPFYGDDKFFEIDSDNVNGLELKINRGGTLSGTVLLEAGKERPLETPINQGNVSMIVSRDSQPGYRTSRISPDGSFSIIGLPAGKGDLRIYSSNESFYVLRVEHNGITQTDGINIGPGENISGVKLIVGKADGVIRGEAKVVGGSLPEGYTLFVSASQTVSTNSGVSRTSYGSANVDEKGSFLIEGLLNGEYTLQISPSIKSGFQSNQLPKMPKPVTLNVSVTLGAETRVSITYDLTRVNQ